MAEASDPNDAASSETHQSDNVDQQTAAPKGVRWMQMILTAVVIVLIGGIGFGGAWYVANTEPALYPVHGFVFLDGEPMAGGAVISFHANDWPGALAGIADDGSFYFTTNGETGAYEGLHRITFTYMDKGFPPTSLLPAEYTDPGSTTFTIDVNAQTGDEDIRFDLSGGKKSARPTAQSSDAGDGSESLEDEGNTENPTDGEKPKSAESGDDKVKSN